MGKMSKLQAKNLLEKYPDAKLHQVGEYYYLYHSDAAQAARHQGVSTVIVTKKELNDTKKNVSDATK